jgi:unsaturated rhamnogalacturonyl hydrolase
MPTAPDIRTIVQSLISSTLKCHMDAIPLWNYEHGLFLLSVLEAGRIMEKADYAAAVRAYVDRLIDDDGSIRTYKKDEFNLDQINMGKVLFHFLGGEGDEKYRAAIELLREQLMHQPRTDSGAFWHKKIYPDQVWLDGLYMEAPFYARYARDCKDPEGFGDVCLQFAVAEKHIRDQRTGLYYHAWDESRKQLWADHESGTSPMFWGRSLGWFGMALVDVLDYLPEGHPERAHLVRITCDFAAAVMRWQDGDSGLWYQVVDQGARPGNYLETSASSMFVYFLRKSLRLGYLDGSAAKGAAEAARKAYAGLLEKKLSVDAAGQFHLEGICKVAGLGGNPYRDGSYEYYIGEPVVRDDDKGLGPFILASLEMLQAGPRTSLSGGTNHE